jgi:tetratricopeptide (TPR) repeat protein
MSLARSAPVGAVEAALEKVLSSPALRTSARLRRFLTYVVRHALAGDADRIKEYSIGVEVFDRGLQFDPRCDSIVRVEALKLREKLLEYYRTDGATDIVTISLPKGAYHPTFDVRERFPAALFDDPENVCWQAESLLLRGTAEDVARTRHYVQRAMERWPSRADLHVTLGWATLAALEMELVSPDEGVPLLRRTARRALSLDPLRRDAHFLARIADIRRPDKAAALRAAHEALRSAPTSATAHFWVAAVLAADCRMPEALVHLQMAVRLQPHALFFQTWRAVALFCTGQRAAGLRHLRDILEFAPRDYLANYWLGLLSARLAKYDEARDAAARAYDVCRTSQALADLGFVEAQAGRIEAAETILQRLAASARTEYVAHSGLGAIHLALGRMEVAAREVRRAYDAGDWELGWSGADPRWEPFRGKIAIA